LSSNTDVEALQVGARIRHARILKGMRMRDLAAAAAITRQRPVAASTSGTSSPNCGL